MLPGFRFLFAAVMFSMSILVFGLGAAALLRAAHEEFASNPSWRAAPEVMFAQPPEATRPVLAMLSVDNPAAEKAQDNAPATAAPAEQAAIAATPSDAERVAVLKPEDSSPAQSDKTEIAQPEVPVAENPVAAEPAPASAKLPTSGEEIKIAATAMEKVSSREDQPVASPVQPNAPGAAIAATKIATLGGPPVGIESLRPAKITTAKPDPSAEKKRQQARRADQRRRIAARARAAAQALAQPANPFSQPAATAVSAR